MPEATNFFTEGMIMDVHPLMTPSNMLTNALNATIITFNGNEFMLLNDMGNGRVETAFLPSGYVPIGVKEYGGIIYIASFNPLLNRSQLGCFPSPERNISSDELGLPETQLTEATFKGFNSLSGFGIQQATLDVYNSEIFKPGDEFCISIEDVEYNVTHSTAITSEYLKNLLSLYGENVLKFFTIKIAILDSSNKLTIIEKLKWFENGTDKYTFPYFNSVMAGSSASSDITLEQYRQQVGSKYNVYANNTSGKIILIMSLEGVNDFEFSINIDAFDKNNVYLSYIASSTKHTKDTHERVPGLFGSKIRLNSANQLQSTTSLDTFNSRLNGAELRGVNLDIKISSDKDLNESGLITTDYTNIAPSNIETGSRWDYVNSAGDTTIEISGSISSPGTSSTGVVKLFSDYITARSVEQAKKLIDNPYYEIDEDKIHLKFYHNHRFNNGSGILTYTAQPVSDLCRLINLERKGQLDFSKIGTGLLEMDWYKYYRNEDSLTLIYSLQYYPTIGMKMKDVYIDFFDVSGNYSIIYKLPYRQNWFGSFQEIINLVEEPLLDEPTEFSIKSPIGQTIGNKFYVVPDKELLKLKKDNFYAISFIFLEVSDSGNLLIREGVKQYRYLYTTRLMNEYYTDRDTLDFKTVTPLYNISSDIKITREDITQHDAVPLVNKYYLSSYDGNFEDGSIVETLKKEIELGIDVNFFTTLEKEKFYFGYLLKDTVFEYEAYTDPEHEDAIRDESITIYGNPKFNPEYGILGSIEQQYIDQYLNLENNPDNLDKIVTKKIIVDGNTYTIEADTEKSHVKRFLLGQLDIPVLKPIEEKRLRPYWEWDENSLDFEEGKAQTRIHRTCVTKNQTSNILETREISDLEEIFEVPEENNINVDFDTPQFSLDTRKGNCIGLSKRLILLATAYVQKGEGTISGYNTPLSATVENPLFSRTECFKYDFPNTVRNYDPPAGDLDLHNSSNLLEGEVLYQSELPTFILIYYKPKGGTSSDLGIDFYHRMVSHNIKSNFFMYGMLTADDKYVMLNHIWLTSESDNTSDYEVTGFYENRWAIQCLVELFKHLYIVLFQDVDLRVKTAKNVMYSVNYPTIFKQLFYTTKKIGTNLLGYYSNFVPDTELLFTDSSIEEQLDAQHEDTPISQNWIDSKTNLPPYLNEGDIEVESPYIYTDKVNQILYTFGREINAFDRVTNFIYADYNGEVGNFGISNGWPVHADIFGESFKDDLIYLDLKRSKYAGEPNPENNLEDRWAIETGTTILGVPTVTSFDGGSETWRQLIERATIKDPDIPNSGNCFVPVNELNKVASRFNPASSHTAQNGVVTRGIEGFFKNAVTTALLFLTLFGKGRVTTELNNLAIDVKHSYVKRIPSKLRTREALKIPIPDHAQWVYEDRLWKAKHGEDGPNMPLGNSLGYPQSFRPR